jgi:hypothetical protein
VSNEAIYRWYCDLCGGRSPEYKTDKVPPDWVEIEYERCDRTFIKKHVCKECIVKVCNQHVLKTAKKHGIRVIEEPNA